MDKLKTIAKQVSLFLLGLGLIAPSLLLVAVHHWQLKQHRREVKHRLWAEMPKDDLVLFSFTENELQNLKWEHEREFGFKGLRYDVVHRYQSGDTITLWCWPDTKESHLYNQLMTALNANPLRSHLPKNTQQLWQSLQQLLFPPPFDLPSVWENVSPPRGGAYLFAVKTFSLSPTSPPPKV